MTPLPFHYTDALLIVNVQNDFCAGGAVPAPHGDKIVPEINRLMEFAVEADIPIFAIRDWHPRDHLSLSERHSPWPVHCIQGTTGAAFHANLDLPSTAKIISNTTPFDAENYSAFNQTDLAERLQATGAERLWIAGLGLEYFIRETAIDARRLGYEVHLIANASRALGLNPQVTERTIKELSDLGVVIEGPSTYGWRAA